MNPQTEQNSAPDQNPAQLGQQKEPIVPPPPPKSRLPLLLTFVFLVVLVLVGGYKLMSKSSIPSSQPTPQVQPSPTPDHTANWETYTNEEFGYTLSYPSEFEINSNGLNSISISKESNEPGRGPMNFIYIGTVPTGFYSEGGEIYNYNTEEANILFNMQIGEIKSLREGYNDPGLEKAFSYTRIPDAKIAGLTAKTYLNTNPWEFPQGTKEYRYYIDKGDNTYLVGAYIEGKDFPQVFYISEEEFTQILSTFRFTTSSNNNEGRLSCEKKGGEWKIAGIGITERCFLKTNDGGKTCTDNNQCETICIAPDDIQEGEIATGICASQNLTLGCNSTLIDGKVQPKLCVD